MLKFISFGSGSSGNCYYLSTGEDALLVDAGVGSRTLKKHFHDYGLQLDSIHHILITHDHADHVKSVGGLAQKYGMPVYSTREVHMGIYKNWSVRKKIPLEQQRNLTKNETVQIGAFRVTPFAVPHDSTDCVGYQIEHDGIVLTVITDCGHITEEMHALIGQSDYLILEANYDPEMLASGPYPEYLRERIQSAHGHLSNIDCGKALAEYVTPRLKHVWLCHLSEENNHPELARKTVETILRSHGIVPGKDFLLDVFKRKIPSEPYELK